MNIDSKNLNSYLNKFLIFFPFSPATHYTSKIAGIVLASFAVLSSLFYLLYLKIKFKGKIHSFNRSSLSSFFPQTLNFSPENAHQSKESCLKAIQDILKDAQTKEVYFKSLKVPTALLSQLIQKEILLEEKELISVCTLESSKGEKFQLTGFEKALLMQHSLPFYNFWKKGEKMPLIQDRNDFDLLKTLLQSLYDPKVLEGKEGEICKLADISFKFQLNEKEIHHYLNKLLIANFEKNERDSIRTLLDVFKSSQKSLTPPIQQVLQKWLNASIGTSSFLPNIDLLKHSSLAIDTLDFSNTSTSISDQELADLRGLSLSKLILSENNITDQGLKNLKDLTQLQVLDLSGCDQITDQGLKYLQNLPQLQTLNLTECSEITNQGLKHLKGLTQLKKLNLKRCCKITNQGLKHLKSLSQLQSLNLSWCHQITDRGVEHLKDLINLEDLDLSGYKEMIDQGLKHLKSLIHLKKLSLYSCSQLTDQGVEHLKNLSQLQVLTLVYCEKVTNQGLKHLKGFTQLKKLSLQRCDQITDSGLESLKGLTQLKELDLTWCTEITNQGLKHLKGLTQLKKLNLKRCCKITNQGLKHLKSLIQLKKLSLYGCYHLTDQALEHLKSFTQLKKLSLYGCYQLTDQGLNHLKSLSQLKKLNLSHCKQITNQGLAFLQTYLLV